MRSFIAIIAVITLSACSASTLEGVQEAWAAYEAGDYEVAAQGFQPLAEQGDALAQHNLGHMYQQGQGVPQDFAEAVRWYRLAAKQGYALSQNALGRMYARAQGASHDYARAYALFDVAVSSGHDAAAERRNTVAQLLSPDALAEAQALSRLWFADPELIE